MDENLRAASEQGNVERLYELIRQDPNVLESINKQMFAHTPLHEAASKGHTMFMMEVIRLMPSFGTKLNPDGFSPIHLALQSPDDRTPTILQLIRANRDVIRVKGRMGMTALHWVAQSGDINLLAEFLIACPESIEDLTDKFETALHVAVKNKKVDAVKIIVGWLARYKWDIHRNKILSLKDHQGNTALLAAVLSEEPEILKALLSILPHKNIRNWEGKTALNVLDEQQSPMDPLIAEEMRKVLTQAGATKAGPSLANSSRHANRLKSRLTSDEKCWLFFHPFGVMSEGTRNALLVVAVLIATATYQVGLNPPDALVHPKSSSAFGSDLLFSVNHILLMFSILIIIVLLPTTPQTLRLILAFLLIYMGLCYFISMIVIMPRLTPQIVASISFFIFVVFQP